MTQDNIPRLTQSTAQRSASQSALPPGGVDDNQRSISPPVGGPPQDLPKFQMPYLTLKSVQTCCNYSPDGDCRVWFKKIDPFMPNGRPIVLPPLVTSDGLFSWMILST